MLHLFHNKVKWVRAEFTNIIFMFISIYTWGIEKYYTVTVRYTIMIKVLSYKLVCSLLM